MRTHSSMENSNASFWLIAYLFIRRLRIFGSFHLQMILILPNAEDRVQSNPLFEERNVDVRRQLFVDFLHTGVQLSISLFLGRIFRYQRYNISHLQEILPKLRSLHKPILAILLLNHLPDRRRQLRPGLRVAPRPIGQYLPYTHLPLLNHLRFLYLLVLKLLQVLRKLPLARELRVHLYHTLGKLKPRESTGRVYLHFLKKVPGEKLPNIRNLLLSMVHTQEFR